MQALLNHLRLRALALLLSVLLAAITGCAKFASSASVTSSVSMVSSASSSEIISSPFRSSSREPCCEAEKQIEEDTEGYTTAWLESGGGSRESFQRGLGEIVARYGISDWQTNDSTWVGVARGMAAAKLSEREIARYAQNWAQGDARIVGLLVEGQR
jgi:hypothetical protein